MVRHAQARKEYTVLALFLCLPAGGLVFAVIGLDGTAGSYLVLVGWVIIMLAFVSFWSLAVRRAWPWNATAPGGREDDASTMSSQRTWRGR